jgi:hypothetical protein
MFHRSVTILIVLGWLASMGWLIHHDVLPAWTARDVPKYAVGAWLSADLVHSQARLESKTGKRIGTAWTEYTQNNGRLSRSDVLWLENLAVLPAIRIQSTAEFTPEGELDEMYVNVYGAGEHISLKGENYSGSMAFEMWVGKRSQLFKIDGAAIGVVGDAMRPFTALPDIAVGQSWRLNALNPLSALSGIGPKFIPMLVKVTGREHVLHRGEAVECFVVTTDRARAWVDARGAVIRQEVDLPIGGTISIVDEPFDPKALESTLGIPLPSGDP